MAAHRLDVLGVERHGGGQQQLAALHVGHGVGEFADVRPADGRVEVVLARPHGELERRVLDEGGEGERHEPAGLREGAGVRGFAPSRMNGSPRFCQDVRLSPMGRPLRSAHAVAACTAPPPVRTRSPVRGGAVARDGARPCGPGRRPPPVVRAPPWPPAAVQTGPGRRRRTGRRQPPRPYGSGTRAVRAPPPARGGARDPAACRRGVSGGRLPVSAVSGHVGRVAVYGRDAAERSAAQVDEERRDVLALDPGQREHRVALPGPRAPARRRTSAAVPPRGR